MTQPSQLWTWMTSGFRRWFSSPRKCTARSQEQKPIVQFTSTIPQLYGQNKISGGSLLGIMHSLENTISDLEKLTEASKMLANTCEVLLSSEHLSSEMVREAQRNFQMVEKLTSQMSATHTSRTDTISDPE